MLLESLELRARRKRFRLLLSHLLSMPQPPAILDVGGTVHYWETLGLSQTRMRRLVLLNTVVQAGRGVIETVVGDGRDLSRYADREFDVVFSNSVLGHVGAFADQLRMAQEIRRVGIHYFVQTPNQDFPIDWRTLVPFFHLLPASNQIWCFRHFAVGRYRKATSLEEARDWATRIRNVRRSELPILFPDGVVVRERVLGLTKSFMVHNFSTPR